MHIKHHLLGRRNFYFLLIASLLSILSLLLPYSSTTGRLVDTALNKTYNLFPIMLLVGLAIFSFFRNSDEIVIAGLLPLLYWGLQGNVSNVGSWIDGVSSPRSGAIIETVNFLLMTYLAVVIVKSIKKNTEWTPEKLKVAVISTAIGILLVVGTWMNWTKTTYSMTVGEFTWKETGTKVFTENCCTLFSNQENWPWQLRNAVLVIGLFVTIYLLLYVVRGPILGFGIFSIGLVTISDPLSWLVGLYPKYLDPVSEGYKASEVQEMGITISREPTIGLWIALGAAAAYLFYGLYIYASSKIIANPNKNQITN